MIKLLLLVAFVLLSAKCCGDSIEAKQYRLAAQWAINAQIGLVFILIYGLTDAFKN